MQVPTITEIKRPTEDVEDALREVEKSLNIHFAAGELKDLKTFGELTEIVLSKMPPDHVADCSTQQAFYKLRLAMTDGNPTIHPQTPLADLFPKKTRREALGRIAAVLNIDLNILIPRHLVVNALLLGCLCSIILAGCGSGEPRKNIPNVSNIKVALNLQRFDRDLFALDTNQLEAGLTTLAQQHPDFLPFFLQEVAHDQSNPNETPLAALTGFVKAPQVRRLQDSCAKAFPDLRDVEKSLTQMLRYHKHYFPERPAPRFVAAVTEFVGDAYAVNDSLMMIGLDMFLGERFSGYNPDFFPQYLRRQFEPPYLPAKVALALASRIVGPPPGERVIDYMINNGKILYVTDLLLPEMPDTLKLAYTAAQLEGCYTNEATLWARLLDMNVLYDPLGPRNQKIVMPGPSSDNVFQEAPGEIGNWVGWRIVQAYMRRRPQTSVQDLLRLREAQQILTEARYKPR